MNRYKREICQKALDMFSAAVRSGEAQRIVWNKKKNLESYKWVLARWELGVDNHKPDVVTVKHGRSKKTEKFASFNLKADKVNNFNQIEEFVFWYVKREQQEAKKAANQLKDLIGIN